MEKEDILAISRRENKNRDLAEAEMSAQAGIYFSILGTHYLVRFVKAKRKTDLTITVLYFAMFILCFVFFVLRLIEAKG